MTSLLLDTHAWAWSLTDDPRLSPASRRALSAAETVLVSSISIFEIGQKVRGRKWPEMQPLVDELPHLIEEQGARVASVTPDMCLLAATMEWDHLDPLDRLLAATAMALGIPLLSADAAFDRLAGCKGWRRRLW